MTNYIAVIFASTRTKDHDDEYSRWSERMNELVLEQPGFIDVVSARDPKTRFGITVSYFKDEQSAQNWKANLEHLEAQRLGRTDFYENYSVKIANVLREYETGNLKAQRSDG